MRTPALYALLLFIAGVLIGVYVEVHAFILFLVSALALGSVAVTLALGNKGAAQVLLLPAIVAGGVFLTQLQTGDFAGNHVSNFTEVGHRLAVTGTVATEPDIRPDKTFLTVKLDSLGMGNRSIPVSGRLRLRIAEATTRFNYRDRIKFESWVSRPYSARNPGAFDYQRYLEIREIHAIAFVGSAAEVILLQSGAGDPFVRSVVAPVRDYISRVFDRDMKPHQAALLKGFLLGDVRFIPANVYQRFKDTGTLHVLAASGANVGYVVASLLLLGKLSGIRRRSIYAVAIIGVIVFSFLAFNQPSVVRAAVMAVIVLFGKLLRRDANWVNTISLAGLIILAFRPLYLFDLGTQLSFAAAYSLILFLPVIEPILPSTNGKLKKSLRYFLIVFWSTLIAQAGVLPILLFHFQTVPLVSFVANLVVVPAVGLVATLGIALTLFSGVPYLSTLLGHLTGGTIDLVLESINYFESWGIPPIEIGAPELLTVLLYYLLLHLVYLIFTRSRLVGIAAIALVLATNVGIWKHVFADDAREQRITILDSWQTATLVLESGTGTTTLINGGGGYNSFDRGESVILPFLRYRGIKRIDQIAVTDTTPANLTSVKTVAAHFNPVSPPGEPQSALTYTDDLVRLNPCTFLDSFGIQIALLLNSVPVQELTSDSFDSDIIIADWYFTREDRFEQIVNLFHPETVIVATYSSRFRDPAILSDLRERFPQMTIHSTRDEGAITIRVEAGAYQVSTMSSY